MKLVIFGATGGSGRQIIEKALEQGHTVKAFARNPARLNGKQENPNVQVVQGDVMDTNAVEQAVQGADAVISALGTPATTKNTVRSQGTQNILRAMEKTGVQRFICLSSMGIGNSRDMLPFHYKYILVPLLLKQGFAEHELQENVVKQSRTQWTIVRPGELSDKAAKGVYRHGLPVVDKTIKSKVSRADVADFVLKQLSDETYLQQAPWVSY
jgi:putative NADH-flavin reductase